MDNIRVFLWAGLGMLLWMTYLAWQTDYAPAPQGPPSTDRTPELTGPPSIADTPDAIDLPALPEIPGSPKLDETVSAPAVSRVLIRVTTDVLDVEIDLRGGDIHSVQLLTYPFKKNEPDIPVTLLNGDPNEMFVFRTGLRAFDNAPEATHVSVFVADQKEYALTPGADELTVRLSWRDPAGISTDKVYRFRRGQYGIGFEQIVHNGSRQPYRAVSYLQIQRRHQPLERSMFDVDSYSFTGPVVYDGDKYEKLDDSARSSSTRAIHRNALRRNRNAAYPCTAAAKNRVADARSVSSASEATEPGIGSRSPATTRGRRSGAALRKPDRRNRNPITSSA